MIRKKACLLTFSLIAGQLVLAQLSSTSMWTWMSGNNAPDISSVYGQKGVTEAVNQPGSRYLSASWTDNNGNLWLFGGNESSTKNDLWIYNTQSRQWTWMLGDSTANIAGVYGTKGVAHPSNKPGARFGSITWKDNVGNFWLFGGYGRGNSGTGYLNDLWRFDVNQLMWTWVKGDSTVNRTGVYGTRGKAAPGNNPGGRNTGVAWADNGGNLWLFGGYGYANTSFNDLNDLWRYNLGTNEWTWIKGDSITNVIGLYDTQGISTSSTKPGCRSLGVAWKDNAGDFWLFGGYGPSASYIGYMNDLWKYSHSTGQWTWMKGDTISGGIGVYGVVGTPTLANRPGARIYSMAWTDQLGRFWLMGGHGITTNYGYLNDVWKYDPATNQWTWVKGSSTTNQYGTYDIQGTPSTATEPGSRFAANTWTDLYGNLWLFGGDGYLAGATGRANDLWKLSNAYVFHGGINSNWSVGNNWEDSIPAPTTILPGMTVIIDPTGGVCVSSAPLTIQAGAELKINSGKTLNPEGGLANFGLLSGKGEISFPSANPTLQGIVQLPITVSNVEVTLVGHTTTKGIHLSNNGKIKLDTFNLNVGSSSITGISSTNFIVANSTGNLIRKVGSSPVTFPVGIGPSYTPVTITKTSDRLAGGAKTSADVDFSVRSVLGVRSGTAQVTRGAVNCTWFISRSSSTANFNIQASWNTSDEMPGFNRLNAYVALVCPPPDNCVNSYDVAAASAASGSGPYTLERIGPFESTASSFIIRSSPIIFEFTGTSDTDWMNASNWVNELIAPTDIIEGIEVIINNNCQLNGAINIKTGGKLAVKAGHRLTLLH